MRSGVAALFWAERPNCVTVSATASPEGSNRERTATGFHCSRLQKCSRLSFRKTGSHACELKMGRRDCFLRDLFWVIHVEG